MDITFQKHNSNTITDKEYHIKKSFIINESEFNWNKDTFTIIKEMLSNDYIVRKIQQDSFLSLLMQNQ